MNEFAAYIQFTDPSLVRHRGEPEISWLGLEITILNLLGERDFATMVDGEAVRWPIGPGRGELEYITWNAEAVLAKTSEAEIEDLYTRMTPPKGAIGGLRVFQHFGHGDWRPMIIRGGKPSKGSPKWEPFTFSFGQLLLAGGSWRPRLDRYLLSGFKKDHHDDDGDDPEFKPTLLGFADSMRL